MGSGAGYATHAFADAMQSRRFHHVPPPMPHGSSRSPVATPRAGSYSPPRRSSPATTFVTEGGQEVEFLATAVNTPLELE